MPGENFMKFVASALVAAGAPLSSCRGAKAGAIHIDVNAQLRVDGKLDLTLQFPRAVLCLQL